MIQFQVNDPSLETQWRSVILFGRNSATYKFAFGKSLLELASTERTRISLEELAEPFSRHVIEHLRNNDKQGSATSSRFLDVCRAYLKQEVSQQQLLVKTAELGFVNVVDAFQVVNGGIIPNPFYTKDYSGRKKDIVITDELLKLKESFHFQNFGHETEARWKLVETAWSLQLNPALLEVEYDEEAELLFIERDLMRRVDVTTVRDALNGYQKGKCFYSFRDISVVPGSLNLCAVDHFLPHVNKRAHLPDNINGVWNLVLADSTINLNKLARVPEVRFLERLYKRNEFYIESKHPLAETIINQTGSNPVERRRFLERHYYIALEASIHKWKPVEELPPTF